MVKRNGDVTLSGIECEVTIVGFTDERIVPGTGDCVGYREIISIEFIVWCT